MVMRVLDGLEKFLAVAVLIMWVTGGHIFRVFNVKIEFSSLDPWMLALGAIVLARAKLFGKPPLWSKFEIAIQRVIRKDLSLKYPLGFLILVFSGLFMAHCLRHWGMHTDNYDLTMLHQPLFRPWDIRPLRCDTCFHGTYFGEHLGFTLYFLTPLTRFFHSDELIFAIQTLVIGISLWLGLSAGPLKQRPYIWLFALIITLSQRALRNSVVWDFREDDLAFGFLLLSLIALDLGKFRVYWALLLAAILTKENVSILTAFLAIPILLDDDLKLSESKRKKIALATFCVSFLWAAIGFRFLIPYFNAETQSSTNIVARFPEFGKTPLEVLLSLLIHPIRAFGLVVEKILSFGAIKYLILLFGPYIYFLRRKWIWIIPAIPGIMMNLLSNAQTQKTLGFHYELIILPFLIFGMWEVMKKTMSHRSWAIALLIALCFSGRWPGAQIQEFWPEPKAHHMSQFLRELPDRGILAASLQPLAQLSHMRELRELKIPNGPVPSDSKSAWKTFWQENTFDRTSLPGHSASEAKYVVFDLSEPWQNKIFQEALNRRWLLVKRGPQMRFACLERGSH